MIEKKASRYFLYNSAIENYIKKFISSLYMKIKENKFMFNSNKIDVEFKEISNHIDIE